MQDKTLSLTFFSKQRKKKREFQPVLMFRSVVWRFRTRTVFPFAPYINQLGTKKHYKKVLGVTPRISCEIVKSGELRLWPDLWSIQWGQAGGGSCSCGSSSSRHRAGGSYLVEHANYAHHPHGPHPTGGAGQESRRWTGFGCRLKKDVRQLFNVGPAGLLNNFLLLLLPTLLARYRALLAPRAKWHAASETTERKLQEHL